MHSEYRTVWLCLMFKLTINSTHLIMHLTSVEDVFYDLHSKYYMQKEIVHIQSCFILVCHSNKTAPFMTTKIPQSPQLQSTDWEISSCWNGYILISEVKQLQGSNLGTVTTQEGSESHGSGSSLLWHAQKSCAYLHDLILFKKPKWLIITSQEKILVTFEQVHSGK